MLYFIKQSYDGSILVVWLNVTCIIHSFTKINLDTVLLTKNLKRMSMDYATVVYVIYKSSHDLSTNNLNNFNLIVFLFPSR